MQTRKIHAGHGVNYEVLDAVSVSELTAILEVCRGMDAEQVALPVLGESKFEIILGKGYYRNVYLAVDKRVKDENDNPDNDRVKQTKYVAVRMVRSQSEINDSHGIDKVDRAEIIEECKQENAIMEQIKQVEGVLTPLHFIDASHEKNVYEVMPLMTFGSLEAVKEIIDNCTLKPHDKDKVRTALSYQMIKIVMELHAKTNVRHLDIKLDNFLLSEEGKVMLSDWQSAAYVDKDDNTWKVIHPRTTSNRQFPKFVFKAQSIPAKRAYSMRDEWALGIALLNLWRPDISDLLNLREEDAMLEKESDREEEKKLLGKYNAEIKFLLWGARRKSEPERFPHDSMPKELKNFIEKALDLDMQRRPFSCFNSFVVGDKATILKNITLKQRVEKTCVLDMLFEYVRLGNQTYLKENAKPFGRPRVYSSGGYSSD